MRCLLEDVPAAFACTPTTTTGVSAAACSGLWVVTTPSPRLQIGVGDVVRVFYTVKNVCWGYLLRRRGTSGWPTQLGDIDTYATTHKLCTWVPETHLWVIRRPTAIATYSKHADMEPFLTRTPHLMPDEGWMSYLDGSGVKAFFAPPCSWQFCASFWHTPTPDLLCGKTGGLHLTENKNNSRRCQLSVEYGVMGDSMVDTNERTRAGVLMYLPSMDVAANGAAGEDVCYESNMSLAFTAILVAYIETVSIVRKIVYSTPYHPHGNQSYACIQWDFSHTPFEKLWTVASAHKRKKTKNLYKFALDRAAVWVAAEAVARPEHWKTPVPLNIPSHDAIDVRVHKHGVCRWLKLTKSELGTLRCQYALYQLDDAFCYYM